MGGDACLHIYPAPTRAPTRRAAARSPNDSAEFDVGAGACSRERAQPRRRGAEPRRLHHGVAIDEQRARAVGGDAHPVRGLRRLDQRDVAQRRRRQATAAADEADARRGDPRQVARRDAGHVGQQHELARRRSAARRRRARHERRRQRGRAGPTRGRGERRAQRPAPRGPAVTTESRDRHGALLPHERRTGTRSRDRRRRLTGSARGQERQEPLHRGRVEVQDEPDLGADRTGSASRRPTTPGSSRRPSRALPGTGWRAGPARAAPRRPRRRSARRPEPGRGPRRPAAG